MKLKTLALLGSAAVAVAAVPDIALAQSTDGQSAGSMTPALDCPPETPLPSPSIPVTVPDDGGIVTGGTPTPGVSPTTTPGGPVFGTPSPVVQPVPTPTPGVTPAPTPSPTVPGGGNVSSKYLTNPDTSRMTSFLLNNKDGKRTMWSAPYTPGYGHQDLATVKTYKAPTNGIIRTIGGQKIAVASTTTNTNFKPRIVNVIDEFVIVARSLGLPDPVITSGIRGAPGSSSLHDDGLAVDLRSNNLTAAQSKSYAMALKQALGPGYDVYWEDWGSANSHIHIEYDGKTR